MINIESCQEEESSKLKRRLLEIAKLLKENERRIDELHEFKSKKLKEDSEEIQKEET